MRLGNGKWETAKFNTRLQVTELGLGASAADAGAWKVNYDYGELDAGGNVIASKNTGNIAKQTLTIPGATFAQAYRYDSLYRLTEAKETTGTNQNWIQNWTYDRYGNRLSFAQNIMGTVTNTTPAINANTNRFVTAGTNFQYDLNGNLIRDAELRQFTFNGDNKQTEVKLNGVTIGRYFFDGEGKRVKKVTDAETTVFVYSGGKLVEEYSTQLSQNPSINYTTTDHLGSPRIITDQLGQVKSRRDFMPFGEDIASTVGSRSANNSAYGAADSVRQKFTGYQKDDETGLDFAEARMYENRHGRFTAVDPLLASGKSSDPQTFNRYVYVMNSPLRLSDPAGLQAGSTPDYGAYQVYFRTFAPYDWFGGFGTNAFRGDGSGRQFSPDLVGPNSSYRMSAVSDARFAGGDFPLAYTYAETPAVSFNGYSPIQALTGGNSSECTISDENYNNVIGEGGLGVRGSFHMSGNDDAVFDLDIPPLNMVAWDIDLHAQWSATFTDMGIAGTRMTVAGSATGDGFPAAESFIYDSFGNGVMLGAFAAPPNQWGPEPERRLAGDGNEPMLHFSVDIVVRDGRFTGVMQGNEVVSIADWNRRFSQMATRRSQ